MKQSLILSDNSTEFLVQKWNNGVKLISPKTLTKKDLYTTTPQHAPKRTVKELFNLPMNVYIQNPYGVIQNINEFGVNSCGFASVRDAIGNSVRVVAEKGSADALLQNNLAVIKNNRLTLFDEEHTRRDKLIFQRLSLKFPWYSQDDKIIGIFGFSIPINEPFAVSSLSSSLNHILNTGLLSRSALDPIAMLQQSVINNIVLSKREKQCMHYLMRGKTAKAIANHLGLSTRTVENYIENIKSKFGVSSKSELIDLAHSHLDMHEH
jgi:DNA-binding CsgD family transcriptional regulator